MKNKTTKRILSLILAMLIICSLAPASVFADDIEAAELYSAETEETAPAEDNSTVLAEEPAEAEPVQEAETPESSEQSAEPVEEAEGTDETEEAEETEEPDEEQLPFEQAVQIDDVIITVTAEAGAFPENSTLFAEKVPVWTEEAAAIDEAVEEVRDSGKEVKEKYTFDIKILLDGEEIEPAEGKSVNVKFSLAKVKEDDMQIDVYHIVETPADNLTETEAVAEEAAAPALEAVQLSTEINTEVPEYGIETEVTVATESFSYYVVEFTYNGKTYVMDGGTVLPLREILDYLEIYGESITDIEISNEELVTAAQDEDGEWYVISLQPFTTEEWMKLSVDGERYEIKLTDAISSNNYSIVYADGNTSPATFGSGNANSATTVTFQPHPDNPGYKEKKYLATDRNGIKINTNSTVVLYIPNGFKVQVTGKDGNLSTPGGAAILLPSSSKLFVVGPGELICQGGKAGAGSQGGNGEAGELTSDQYLRGGTGGKGGSGGGGAGAGIGTNGGDGGAGGAGGVFHPTDGNSAISEKSNEKWYIYAFINHNFNRGTPNHSSDRDGGNGGAGSQGGNSSGAGKVYFLYNSKFGKTNTNIKGGAANDTNGDFGSNVTSYSKLSKYGNDYGYGGGGGGGGGQGGRSAYDIGQGGSGGAGGGGGGSGGTFLGNISSDYPPVGGYGGSFLSGYDVRGYYGIEAYGAKGGTGGHAGAVKSDYSGIQTGSGEDINIDPFNSDNTDIKKNIEYKIKLISQDAPVENGIFKAYYGLGFPQEVSIPKRNAETQNVKSLVFHGYYTEKDGNGTQIYDAGGKATDKFYALSESSFNRNRELELYACWKTVAAGIRYTYYTRLDTAVNAAKAGDTITMYSDVDVRAPIVFERRSSEGQVDKRLVLDLNGCTIRCNSMGFAMLVEDGVSLEIKNIDTNSRGTIQNVGKNDRTVIMNNGGNIKIDDSRVRIFGQSTDRGSGFAIENHKGNIEIRQGTLEGYEFNGTSAAGLWVSGGRADIYGGTLSGGGDRTVSACCIYATNGQTNIHNGKYTGTVHGIYVNGANATVNIDNAASIRITGNGEQKKQEGTDHHGYGVYVKAGKCNINGGVINGYSAAVRSEVDSGIKINNQASHIQLAVETDENGNRKPPIEGALGTTIVDGGFFGSNVQYWCNTGKSCYHISEIHKEPEEGCEYLVQNNDQTLKINGQNEIYSGKGIKGYTVTGDASKYSFACHYTGFDNVKNQDYDSTECPVNYGDYKVRVTYSRSTIAGTQDVSFSILPADLKIVPNPGMKKNYGEKDPVLDFTTESLKNDADKEAFVAFKSEKPVLLRREGSDVGFYSYYVNPSNSTFIKNGEYASNYKAITLDESTGEQFEIVGMGINVDVWPQALLDNNTYTGNSFKLLSPVGMISKEHSRFASFYYSTDGINFSPNVPESSNAGTYTIKYYVHSNNKNFKPIYRDKDNITDPYFTVVSEIKKADPVYEPPVGLELVYSGEAQRLAVQKIKPSAGCKMEYSLTLGEEAVWSADPFIPSAIEVGNYKVYYRVKGNSNYYDVPENETHYVEAKIKKVPVPEMDLEASDLTYGDTLSLSEISNVPQGWSAKWENGTQILPVGIHSCRVVVEGPDNKSYETEPIDVNVAVYPREAQIFWNWDSEKNYYIYDGQAHCPDARILNLLPGDECLIKYEGQAIEIGEHKAFIESISNSNYVLPAEESENYPSRSCDFSIKSWEYIYGEDTYGIYDNKTEYSIKMRNVPANAKQNYRWAEVDNINLTQEEMAEITTWDNATTNPAFKGGQDKTCYYCVQYKITANKMTFDGVNYVIVYADGLRPEITALPLPNSRIFDGVENKTITAEATATYNEEPCEVEYAVASMDNLSEIMNPNWQSYADLDAKRDAGYYFTLMRAFVEDGGVIRYSDIKVVESSIEQKDLIVQWKKDEESEPETVDEFVYQLDGKVHVPVAAGEIVDKEKLELLVTPTDSKNVGKYTATVTIEGADKGNYMLISSPQNYKIEGQSGVQRAPQKLSRELVYDEMSHALVSKGTAVNGTMMYSLDNRTWSLNVPQKTDSGYYDVYYMVRGFEGYRDFYAAEPLHVRLWPDIVYKIYNAVPGDSIMAEYDERLTESVIVNKNLTIDLNGYIVSSAENSTLIVDEDVTLELTNTYKGIEGGFVNTAEGKTVAAVNGTLNINNSSVALKGSTAVKCESGGTALISSARISGALEAAEGGNLKAKGGFYSEGVGAKYLFSEKITDGTGISKTALCFANGREDTKAEYPFRVSTARTAASNLLIGSGTTVRIYVYLDGEEDDEWSFEVKRENTGGGEPWIEYPELSEETGDIYGNGLVNLPFIDFNGVNPQCMSNNVETTIYLNGEQAYDTSKFSVKEYSNDLHNAYSATTPKLEELVANMLEYGAAAQKYKNYNTDNMANGNNEIAANKTPYETPTGYEKDYSRIGKVSGYEQYRFKGVGLLFGDKVNMYFTFPQSIDSEDLVIEIDGQEVSKYSDYNKYVKAGNYAGFSEDISITDISKVIEVVMYYKGVETDRITFSPGLYVQNYADSNVNPTINPVVKRYYEFAKSGIKYENS